MASLKGWETHQISFKIVLILCSLGPEQRTSVCELHSGHFSSLVTDKHLTMIWCQTTFIALNTDFEPVFVDHAQPRVFSYKKVVTTTLINCELLEWSLAFFVFLCQVLL